MRPLRNWGRAPCALGNCGRGVGDDTARTHGYRRHRKATWVRRARPRRRWSRRSRSRLRPGRPTRRTRSPSSSGHACAAGASGTGGRREHRSTTQVDADGVGSRPERTSRAVDALGHAERRRVGCDAGAIRPRRANNIVARDNLEPGEGATDDRHRSVEDELGATRGGHHRAGKQSNDFNDSSRHANLFDSRDRSRRCAPGSDARRSRGRVYHDRNSDCAFTAGRVLSDDRCHRRGGRSTLFAADGCDDLLVTRCLHDDAWPHTTPGESRSAARYRLRRDYKCPRLVATRSPTGGRHGRLPEPQRQQQITSSAPIECGQLGGALIA